MKRAALYCRVSTIDQHPETQANFDSSPPTRDSKSPASTSTTASLERGRGDRSLTG